jgi:hypothetical protein
MRVLLLSGTEPRHVAPGQPIRKRTTNEIPDERLSNLSSSSPSIDRAEIVAPGRVS